MNNKNYQISVDTYNNCLRTFQTIEDRFGISVHVIDEDKLLDKGQIFVFNHFARFEAAIPIYFIYKATGAFTRTIADHRLFNLGGEKFQKFLKNGGALPNNLEGLLPFLAAEILRGRKAVIFPEGGMIKNRQVYHKEHGFQLLSGLSGKMRKQHRGAAVLALTLDLFKERIKDLHERGDTKRLAHWRDALEIESIEKLLEQAYRPTLVVPGNITFYPMRIKENLISKAVKFFVKKMPDQLSEELTIESNILLKDTDMTVNFSNSVEIAPKLGWWRKLLLRHFFNKIDSLEDFFSLSQKKEGFFTKFIVRFMYTETHSIRDQYMEMMYRNVTINISHIAATLLHTIHKHHKSYIERQEFETLVQNIITQLQHEPNISIHESISEEMSIADVAKELKLFYETLEYADLIKVNKQEILLHRSFDKIDYDIHEVRIKNPAHVFVNEAVPVPAVRRATLMALRQHKKQQKAQELTTAELEGASL